MRRNKTKNMAAADKMRRSMVRKSVLLGVMLPFSLSLLICTAVFGAIGFTTALLSSRTDSNAGQAAAMPESSCNLLLFVQDDVSQSLPQILLLRLDGEKNQLFLTPVPPNLGVMDNNTPKTLTSAYSQSGTAQAAGDFSALTGVKLQYHASLTLSGLKQLIDGFGGVIYDLPTEFCAQLGTSSQGSGGSLTPGNQLLSGEKAASVIKAASLQGWQQQSSIVGGLAEAFLLQKLNATYLGSDDDDATDFYKKTFNFMESNWSMRDMVTWAGALRGLSGGTKSFAELIPLSGAPQNAQPGGSITLSAQDKALLRDDYEAGH